MELLQLKYFCNAAETENFSITARHFSVPPSAISQSVRRLETELGTHLFTRHANTVSLNAAGEGFYEKANAALTLLDEAVGLFSENTKGRLNICINVSRRRILPIIEQFRKEHPEVDLRIKHLADPTGEDFDLVFAGEDSRLIGYRRNLLATEQLAIAVHKSNPLATRENISVSMLQNEPFIMMNEQSSMHAIALAVCAESGFRPRIALQSDDPAYLVRLIELNMGVAIVPFFQDRYISDEVLRFPIQGCTRDTFVYMPKNKRITPQAEAFIEMLRREYVKKQECGSGT